MAVRPPHRRRPKRERPLFYCTSCGNEHARWFGQCPACGEWNKVVEAPSGAPSPGSIGRSARGPAAGSPARVFGAAGSGDPPRPLTEREPGDSARVPTGIGELDRALGGGLVPGSVVLLGGDPGVGKSTLALQAAGALGARANRAEAPEGTAPVLYVTGEESRRQVGLRADRLEGPFEGVLLAAGSDVEEIASWVATHRPALVIVDSIQTACTPDVEGAPGSLTQVRESGLRLHALAKTTGTAVVLIGHVTKEGSIAGPRHLEHMVDTVLYLEGEKIASHRVLRAVKNRFGSTDEIGIFEMRDRGLVEVRDPSRLLADASAGRSPGACVVPAIEGTRPILLEIQALVTETSYGYPQRVATGIDPKRLAVLLAVLRKHASIDLGAHDVFVNVVAGIRISEPSADLGIVAAVASSFVERPVPEGLALFGEVGLGGEVRGVSQADRRASEARRVGFERLVVPKRNLRDLEGARRACVIAVSNVSEALGAIGMMGASRSAAPRRHGEPQRSGPEGRRGGPGGRDRFGPRGEPGDFLVDPPTGPEGPGGRA